MPGLCFVFKCLHVPVPSSLSPFLPLLYLGLRVQKNNTNANTLNDLFDLTCPVENIFPASLELIYYV